MPCPRRLLSLLALAVVLLAAPGCPAFTRLCKAVYICPTPEFELPEKIPPDFHLAIRVRDQQDPPADYQLQFDRTGKVRYEVTLRAPRRRQQQGEIEITEDQVLSLWKAVSSVRFDELSERYPDDGDGKDRKAGAQRYYVVADGMDKAVEAVFERPAELETIRKAALAVLPQSVLLAEGGPEAPADSPDQFVGDTADHKFHLPTCPLLEKVPSDRRQPFGSKYDAINFGFDPCTECRPLSTR